MRGRTYAGPVRFLLSRRWLAFAVVVALLAYLAYLLGVWQFHRLDDRRAENRVVATNLAADPVPVTDALDPGRAPGDEQEWQHVTASGTWDDTRTVVVKYQTRDGEPGVDVVTPLVLDDGEAVLVNRGWLAADNSGGTTPDVPEADPGRVNVTGYVRNDATGDSARVTDGETRAVSSTEIGTTLPYPVLRGWVELQDQDPEAGTPLAPAPLPDDTSEGPHFFYGLQWWFFGALAVFGFLYLAYDERRGGGRRDAVRQRRELAAARAEERRAGRSAAKAAKAEEAAQLVAWRYGDREDRPTPRD